MIARVGYFEGLTAEQKAAQEDNGKRRLKPFLITQPGLVAAIYLETLRRTAWARGSRS